MNFGDPKKMIKNIIFDVGNVLVNFRDIDYMLDLGFSKELAEYFQKHIVKNPLWQELDRGVLKPEDVMNEMKTLVPEYPKEADLFFERLDEIVESFPYAKEWLMDLRKRGYCTYLLSNYPKDLFEHHVTSGRFTFIDQIDGKIVSAYEKVIKPDPAIYKILLDRYTLVPEECVFLDDRLENVEGAKAFGIHGIHFTDYKTAKEQLENLLENR